MTSTTTSKPSYKSPNKERWWMGAVASMIMGTITLPLDLFKVQLQTETQGRSMITLAKLMLQEKGFFGLYAGYTALLVAQFVYAVTRFNLYQLLEKLLSGEIFWYKVIRGGVAGGVAGVVGNPPGLVQVRMQNDSKLPAEERRNYKHVFHGLYSVIKNEGVLMLFTGGLTGMYRGIGMTIGQLSIYDHAKYLLMLMFKLEDTVTTHLMSACIAAVCATIITHPLDVAKTRLMTSPRGTYRGLCHCLFSIILEGPLALMKGLLPAFIRQIMNTNIMFVILEQFKRQWGIPPEEESTSASTLTTLANMASQAAAAD